MQIGFLAQGDSSVISPVANGWIEKESSEKRQETEQQEREETETEMPKEQESEDREKTDLTKLPLPQASEGVKPELRPQKSEKTCELLQTYLLSREQYSSLL